MYYNKNLFAIVMTFSSKDLDERSDFVMSLNDDDFMTFVDHLKSKKYDLSSIIGLNSIEIDNRYGDILSERRDEKINNLLNG